MKAFYKGMIVAGVVLSVACTEPQGPPAASESTFAVADRAEESRIMTIDEHFEDLGRRIPGGFGGLVYDEPTSSFSC